MKHPENDYIQAEARRLIDQGRVEARRSRP